MNGLRKKMRKTSIFGHFGPNSQFWTVFGQNGQNGNFFKKALGTLFSRLQALTNCKVSEKSNERFSSNRVTYGRTDVHTDGRESLGLQRLRRETKNDVLDICEACSRRFFLLLNCMFKKIIAPNGIRTRNPWFT